jgi:hypothetical protein
MPTPEAEDTSTWKYSPAEMMAEMMAEMHAEMVEMVAWHARDTRDADPGAHRAGPGDPRSL